MTTDLSDYEGKYSMSHSDVIGRTPHPEQSSKAVSVLSSGSRHGLPVPNSPYGLCGRKATLDEEELSHQPSQCLK